MRLRIYHRSCATGAALVNMRGLWDCWLCGRHAADCKCEKDGE
jgi:hypothetical protein